MGIAEPHGCLAAEALSISRHRQGQSSSDRVTQSRRGSKPPELVTCVRWSSRVGRAAACGVHCTRGWGRRASRGAGTAGSGETSWLGCRKSSEVGCDPAGVWKGGTWRVLIGLPGGNRGEPPQVTDDGFRCESHVIVGPGRFRGTPGTSLVRLIDIIPRRAGTIGADARS